MSLIYLVVMINSGLWITAAKFEFEERNNIVAARTLFQQGLRVNPTAQKLWLEVFINKSYRVLA